MFFTSKIASIQTGSSDNNMKRIFIWIVVGFISLSVLSFLFGKSPKQNGTPATETKANTTASQQEGTTPQPKFETSKPLSKEEIDSLAAKYCEYRAKHSATKYPIPVVISDMEFDKPKDTKAGNSLTAIDCQNIIAYLADLNTKIPASAAMNLEKVADGKAWIGMNIYELLFSYGNPDKINKSNYGSGVREQWVYNYGSAGNTYFYLEGDPIKFVTSYQDY